MFEKNELEPATDSTLMLNVETLDENFEDFINNDDIPNTSTFNVLAEQIEEIELPVHNLQDYENRLGVLENKVAEIVPTLNEIQNNLKDISTQLVDLAKTNVKEIITSEFARCTMLLTGVLKQSTNIVTPLLPSAPPNENEPASAGFGDALNELNTPIATEAGVEKLEAELKVAKSVQRYVSFIL